MNLACAAADNRALNAVACEGEIVLTSDGKAGRSVCTALTPTAALETAARLVEAAQAAIQQAAGGAGNLREGQLSILRLLNAAGGYYAGAFVDRGAVDRCLTGGWIVTEGETGFALTLDGSCALRRGSATP